MADLQSCYFCGTPDDVQEYAVVPPRLGGDDDRSVPLCDQCKTKLLRVMDPLIEQVEDGENGAAPEAGSRSESASASGSPETQQSTDPSNGITMGAGAANSGEAETGPGAAGAGTDETDTGSAAPSGPAGPASEDTPQSYRRAMRMLSNRPFPVDRTEVESMLAAAYDLEREEVDAVIDHAIEDGKLVEENGQLREP